jgi:hypothetical protein
MRAPSVKLRLGSLEAGSYRLNVHRTGFRANDAYSAYIDMGAPKDLSSTQLGQIENIDARPPGNRSYSLGREGRLVQILIVNAQQRRCTDHARQDRDGRVPRGALKEGCNFEPPFILPGWRVRLCFGRSS